METLGVLLALLCVGALFSGARAQVKRPKFAGEYMSNLIDLNTNVVKTLEFLLTSKPNFRLVE